MPQRAQTLSQSDPELWKAICGENARQETHVELIASENYASPAVMAAQGSQLTNKYAEGYPGRRYYGGCEVVDQVEQLAIDRVKRLFSAEHANVQPHSGAQANQAVFFAVLEPGDTVLGMSLPHGGHLTHGSPVNMSGKWFNVVAYGLDPVTELIDYDEFCGGIPSSELEGNAIREIQPSQLAQRLDGGEQLEIIDVREPYEWQLGHIPGARLVPLDRIVDEIPRLDKRKETILYCKVGVRSMYAAHQLADAGLSDVRNLAGGILRWIDEVDPTMTRY